MAVSLARTASENQMAIAGRRIFYVGEQSPEGESGGGQVEVRERTLREEDWVERGADGGGNCNLGVGDSLRPDETRPAA